MKADEEIVVREEASGVTAAADAWRDEAAGATRRRRPQTRPRARLGACRGSPLAAGAIAPGSEARRTWSGVAGGHGAETSYGQYP